MHDPVLTGLRLRDHALVSVAWSAAALIVAAAAWLVVDLTLRGVGALSLELVLSEPRDAGRAGGLAPILASTALILATCLALVVPLGLATAVLLAERIGVEQRLGRLVRRSLDVLAAVPSIVFGLFGNAFFCVALGMGFSILAGGLTLAVMVLPLFVRFAEQAVRAVETEHRHAAAALGLSRTTTLLAVVLPRAVPALAAALVLSLGRAAAETAALLFTSGFVTRMPESLLDSGRSLSVHVLDLAMNVPGGDERAAAAALLLLAALLLVNAIALALADRLRRRIEATP